MRLQRIREHYERRVHPERENYDILDWSSRSEQEVRFEVLQQVLVREGIVSSPAAESPRKTGAGQVLSVLDVGCGMADLRPYLMQTVVAPHYVGVDITPQILREAKKRQPEAELLLADVFYQCPFRARAFDVVFCSGLFNLDVGNNRAFVAHALPVLFALADKCLVANFLHFRATQRHDHCCYFDPADLLKFIPPEAERVDVMDQYLEKDFTIAALRKPITRT